MDKPSPLPPPGLANEVDARMTQALGNFFQRNREAILDGLLRAIDSELTSSMLASGQTCMDWLTMQPDRLSSAFADAFRHGLAAQACASAASDEPTDELRLVDEDRFARQLDENRAVARIVDALGPEMTPLFGRLARLRQSGAGQPMETHGPGAIIAALSCALDTLGFDVRAGSLLLRNSVSSLEETLRHTYVALDQLLAGQNVEAVPSGQPVVRSRRPRGEAPVGEAILTHLRTLSSSPAAPSALTGTPAPLWGNPGSGTPSSGARASFLDSLDFWQLNLPRLAEIAPATPALLLRQLQRHAHETDAGGFDLAILDAVASLFEFILDDPSVSAGYKSEIAQLQIPTLRIALTSPDFFSDDTHPVRRTLDLLGLYSRRFPDTHASHDAALGQVESACTEIINQTVRPLDAFTEAHDTLSAWLDGENARADAKLAAEVALLEQIERQELGTLLALESLRDLTSRHPAPESVLRRLETAWVPYMASLYVAEAGEGPAWRAAGATLTQLFLSFEPPADEAAREARLASIPGVNLALRTGLLAQGATSEQLRDFFGALTATQECWIRPALGRQQAAVQHFVPQTASDPDIEAAVRHLAEIPAPDPALRQAEALLEGDWVDFDPPYEGLDTARVGWVGVHGYLLFSDSEGETRFSLDSERLAIEIRAGRASIPEQSLTRKAMLRLETKIRSSPA